MNYKPMMSKKEVEIRLKWHNSGFIPISKRKSLSLTILGMKLRVPKEVYAPQPRAPQPLGKVLLKEVKETDRVLDVGTGSGINAILAATKSSNVVAVDINPFAIKSARENAEINGVCSRIAFMKSARIRKDTLQVRPYRLQPALQVVQTERSSGNQRSR